MCHSNRPWRALGHCGTTGLLIYIILCASVVYKMWFWIMRNWECFEVCVNSICNYSFIPFLFCVWYQHGVTAQQPWPCWDLEKTCRGSLDVCSCEFGKLRWADESLLPLLLRGMGLVPCTGSAQKLAGSKECVFSGDKYHGAQAVEGMIADALPLGIVWQLLTC